MKFNTKDLIKYICFAQTKLNNNMLLCRMLICVFIIYVTPCCTIYFTKQKAVQ